MNKTLLTKAGLTFALIFSIQATLAQSNPATEKSLMAYFNQRTSSQFTEPYRNIVRNGDDLERVIVQQIGHAKRSIDVAVMSMTLPNIARALVEAKQRGVAVRVVLDNSNNRNWIDLSTDEVAALSDKQQELWLEINTLVDINGDGEISDEERAARDVPTLFTQANIPVIDDTNDGSKGSGLMHHKFLVIDGAVVVSTSANFTHSGFFGDFGLPNSRGNAENLVVVKSVELAQLYQAEFNYLWGDGPGTTKRSKFGVRKPYRPARTIQTADGKVQVQFSPFSRSQSDDATSSGLIARTLSTASSSIDIAAYVFTDAWVAEALRQAHTHRNIALRGAIDRSFVYYASSATLDMWGIRRFDANCELKPQTHPWEKVATHVGYPWLPEGDKLHHKIAVIDRRTVITGSHNWSAAANRTNDENLLVIESPALAAEFQQEMDRLHQSMVYGPSSPLLRRAAKEQQRCALAR
ncbi:phospholipase D-like domain-containing protein [Ralstonia sp. UBA689]|uniref:phospholipase D-like domain-containing protein n=1 Tax=Ralstonia sp. UBA689 TaxID=1947373 RepID=UPI0025E41C0A|nr:phosphatidylserine/phosphatidylglycerophosphate/cardiolipin synthase family protein [Ralstonia sp. UBA689]